MNKPKIALFLAIIAGSLCVAKFLYTYYQSGEVDYTILLAGIFIIAFGISTTSTKPQ